jgi:hypothetical protein
MARLAFDQGDVAMAGELCDRVLALAPRDADTLGLRGWLAFLAGQYAGAAAPVRAAAVRVS